MKSLLLLKQYILNYRKTYIISIIFFLISSILTIILPKWVGIFTDLLQNSTAFNGELVKWIVLIFGLALTMLFSKLIYRHFLFRNQADVRTDMTNELYKHIQNLPYGFFQQQRIGDLMAHFTNDMNNVQTFLIQAPITVITTFFTGSLTIILLLSIQPTLTLIAFIPLPIIVLFLPRLFNTLKGKQNERQSYFGNLSTAARESISGIKVIKSFVQERNNNKIFDSVNSGNRRLNISITLKYGWLEAAFKSLTALSVIIVVVFGGIMVMNNTISLGDFIAFNLYLNQIFAVVFNIGLIVTIFSTTSASCERLAILMEEKEEEQGISTSLEEIKGRIDIEKLSFQHKDSQEWTLKDITIHISQGDRIGIMGTIGSGKTSLINLLFKIYSLDEGSIKIDGIDINHISLTQLRENIGFVPQDSQLFSTSILENIGFGLKRIQESKAWEMLEMVDLKEEVEDFPQGLQTIVGEKGVRLSGGQKQRLAIARALVSNPPILILDDALSAVDTHTEKEILENIYNVRQGKTTIFIAHRISTLKDSTHIYVLDEGMIKEQGSHEQLLHKKGIYYNTYEAQRLQDDNGGDYIGK